MGEILIYGKQRKCRECSKPYKVPSKWPGCCSSECRQKRNNSFKEVKKKNVGIKSDYDRWLTLRYKAFIKYGNKCLVCGSKENLQVDHILPRSKFPELTFDINNLQILCSQCNKGKSNKFYDDWRIVKK